MIVIIRPDATQEQRDDVEKRIRASGLQPELSTGRERDVVVVVGETRGTTLVKDLDGHPAVERLVEVLPQRRYEHVFSRRSFLDVFIASAVGLLALITTFLGVMFLGRSGEELRRKSLLRVGSLAEFEARPYKNIDDRGRQIIVMQAAGGDFHALSRICTHSEICHVDWTPDRQELRCPCHLAAFDVFGNVLHGPPPRPLRSYPVQVIGDEIYLKLGD